MVGGMLQHRMKTVSIFLECPVLTFLLPPLHSCHSPSETHQTWQHSPPGTSLQPQASSPRSVWQGKEGE